MGIFNIIKIFQCIIHGLTFLISIFAFLIIIRKMIQGTILTSIINLLLTLICCVNTISFLLYEVYDVDFKTFFSPIGDIGKISIALIIMLLGQLSLVPSESLPTREKLYLFISIFIGLVIPLSISITSSCLGQQWNNNQILFIIVISLRYILIVIFIGLSIKVKYDMKKAHENEEIPNEYYNAFRGKLMRYIIIVVYNLIILLMFSLFDILNTRELVDYDSVLYLIIKILYELTNTFYLIGFIFNVEKWKELVNMITCRNIHEDKINKEKKIVELLEENNI